MRRKGPFRARTGRWGSGHSCHLLDLHNLNFPPMPGTPPLHRAQENRQGTSRLTQTRTHCAVCALSTWPFATERNRGRCFQTSQCH